MRKTPPIWQVFYRNSNNWFIGSLKQKMATDPQHSTCSVLETFQATYSIFLHLSRVQPVGLTEIHQPSPPVTLIYKHRGTKMHLSWPTSGHPHIQTTDRFTLPTCGCHIWVQMFFTKNVLAYLHTHLRPCYRPQIGVFINTGINLEVMPANKNLFNGYI